MGVAAGTLVDVPILVHAATADCGTHKLHACSQLACEDSSPMKRFLQQDTPCQPEQESALPQQAAWLSLFMSDGASCAPRHTSPMRPPVKKLILWERYCAWHMSYASPQ